MQCCSETTESDSTTSECVHSQRALAALGDCLWEFRADGEFWSGGWLSYVLHRPELEGEFSSELFARLLHPDDKPTVLGALRVSCSQQIAFDQQFRLLGSSQEYAWFRAWGVPTIDPESGVAMVSGAMKDITHFRVAAAVAEEQARQGIRRQRMEAVDCLASGIAHEFNNLLQAVCGYVEFARKSMPDDSPIREDLTKALEAAEVATLLTRRLLEFAGAEGSRDEEFDVRKTVIALNQLLSPISGQGIEITIEPLESPAVTKGDSMALQQTLLNLMINARDAMPHGGRLLLRAELFDCQHEHAMSLGDLPPGHYVRFLVNDEGSGIAPNHLASVFEPFFTTKEVLKGTGLGLSVAHGVVARMGGHIDLASQVGQGTAFSVYVPLVRPPATRRRKRTLQGVSVLYLSESPLRRELGRALLSESGVKVTSRETLDDYIDTLRNESGKLGVAVVELEGDPLPARLLLERHFKAAPSTPVLLVTPLVLQARALLKGLREEARVVVLPHPYDASQIVGALREAVNTPLDPNEELSEL